MFQWVTGFWLDELGQVGGTQDTSESDGSAAAATQDGEGGGQEEAAADAGTENSGEESGETQETFVDPESLSEEVRNSKEFKGMQRAYAKKAERFRNYEEKIKVLDRISNDADYRRQFVQAAAQGTGLQFVSTNGQAAPQNGNGNGDLASVVKAALPPEYAEAIPGLADVIAAAVDAATKPIKEQAEHATRSTEKRLQTDAWNKAAAELTELDPEWEDDSEDIGEVLSFLQGPEMFHPVWGNKLVALRKLVKGDDFATAEAVKRMRSAVKSKTQTGQSAGPLSLMDIHKQISEKKSSQDKWKTAGQFAIEQLKRGKAQ